MTKIYYELIIKGLKKLDDVPSKLRDKVAKLLEFSQEDTLV